jgi:hypothetical protein
VQIIKIIYMVSIAVDNQLDPQLDGPASVSIGQVKPLRRGIDFQKRAGFCRRPDESLHIKIAALAPGQQAPGGVGELL